MERPVPESTPNRGGTPGFLEFPNARHPRGDGSWTVRIGRDFVDWLSRNGPAWKFHALFDVPALMLDPRCIFLGLEREGTEEFFCYVGRPSRRRRQDGRSEPTPPDRALFVFVSEGGTILKWRWEAVEPDVPLEESCQTRFGTLLWRKR